MIRKVMICPFFGPLPDWMDAYRRNVDEQLTGYAFLYDHDERSFQDRVTRTLGIKCPPMAGTGNLWDFRAALGVLYADEIEGFDFWGHTDFDCVYGRVDKFVTDDFLSGLEMHSNCATYVNGCWSLYRNAPHVNNLFRDHPGWRGYMSNGSPSGWVEREFSDLVRRRLSHAWTEWQVYTGEELERLRWKGSRLMLDTDEVMMAHFRRTKTYPKALR